MNETRSPRYNLFRILLLAGFLLGVALLVQTGSTYVYVYRNLVIGAAMREAVEKRKETAATSRAGQNSNDHDEVDRLPYKKGSAEDRTMRQGNNSV